jgi:hypothetical protein
MARDRTKNLVVRIDAEERAQLAALEDAGDENASRLVRKWISLNYRAAFGDVAPKPKTKRAS